MKNFSIILSTVAVILAAVALVSTSKCKTAGNGAAISAEQVSAVLTQNPKIIADAMQAYENLQREEAEKAAQAALQAHATELNSTDGLPFVGPKDAKVTVVEFFDFSCGYCKRLAPSMEKIIADNPDVKVIFKPVSFVSKVSGYQAKAGLAADKQGKFLAYYTKVMNYKSGPMTEETIDSIAQEIGLDMEQYKKDLNSSDVEKALNSVATLTGNIHVNGVPMVFVNVKHVPAMSPEPIQEAINNAK
ncbi:MAG: DsbA family protein [Alphaproteobacteria bacterium]|nr:DsbA family protein [Alphaproteobacteria bacterium]